MMKKTDTLKRIKQAEEEVRALKARAGEERERIIKDAKREALRLEDELKREGEEKFSAIIKEAEAAIRMERDRILGDGRRRAGELKEEGLRNLDAAVEFLLKRFEEAVHAEA